MKVLPIILTNLFYLLLITQPLIAQTEEFRTEYNGDDLMLLLGLDSQMACIENITDPNDNTINYLCLKARNSINQAGLYMASNGYIVVGTDDPCDRVPSVQAIFNVDGDFYVEGETYKENGNAFFTIISDKRLKKNIQPLEKETSLSKLQEIRVYDFEYKDSGIKRSGIIAQEIKDVLPQTVNTFEKSGSEFYNFNPNDLFYLHINATQELNSLVTEQEQTIEQLKQENQAIGDKLKQTVQTLIVKEQEFNQAVQSFQNTKDKLNDLERKYQALVEQMDGLVQTLDITKYENINVRQSNELTEDKKDKGRLEQNIPNPTRNETTINYSLAETITSAYLTISNSNGQVIKQYPLTVRGEGNITIQLKDFRLKGGIYYYHLVVDGESVDSKKMVLVD